MLRFTCTCGKRLKAPPSAAGRTTFCPQCGWEVRVPAATSAGPESAEEAVEVAPGEGQRDDTGHDDTDPLLARRRRLAIRRRNRVIGLAALVVCLLVAIFCVVGRPARKAPPVAEVAQKGPPALAPQPSPARPPEAPRSPNVAPGERPATSRPAVTPNRVVPREVEEATAQPPAAAAMPNPPLAGQGQPGPVLVSPAVEPFESDRPKKEAFAGYYLHKVSGFLIYVSALAYDESDKARGAPLKVVDDEIARIVELFNDTALKALRTVPVWVEWDHTVPANARAFAVYYGTGGEGLLAEGVDPRKSGCVCVLSLKTAYRLKQRGARQNTLLHEFAHVVHAVVYGRDNAFIANAYEQATARGLYARVQHDAGQVREAYAAKNQHEYFAELTCAYMDRLDYAPHDRAELREHDPVGYEIMTKAWGTPEQIEQMKARRKKKP